MHIVMPDWIRHPWIAGRARNDRAKANSSVPKLGHNRLPETHALNTNTADWPPPPHPVCRFFADVVAEVAAPIECGRGPLGLRRMIPILDGQASGEGWKARILPGGADYQLVIGDTIAQLEAHYVLETDGGDRIYVHNSAIRHASAEITARLMRGESVDPELVYFRCLPRLETGSRALAWINERLFVGTGIRRPNHVVMKFFELA